MSAAATAVGLGYGDLQKLLRDMHDASAEVVEARFRKLRQRPFPGEIRSGTGRRLVYDLSRILSIAAVFEVNRLNIPQGTATLIVENFWPEWARAFLVSATELKFIASPAAMPRSARPMLQLAGNALDDDEVAPFWVPSKPPEGPALSAGFPTLVFDARRAVTAVASALEAAGHDAAAIGRGFEELERKFGWTPPELPYRAELSDIQVGRGFLEDGPYVRRAEALLDASEEAFEHGRHPARRDQLQWLIGYLEQPVPVDVWKGLVAPDETVPRLGQMLSMHAVRMGLTVGDVYPSTTTNAAGELRGAARATINMLRGCKLRVG